MGKKWMILLGSFSVLTLISSVLCTSLIYFSEQARTDINSKEVVAANNMYKSISINYNQNNVLNLSNLNPGDLITKTFSITNNNSNTINYKILWSNVSSTWNTGNNYQTAHPEEFVYTLTCSNGEKIENKQMPLADDEDLTIINNLELKTNKTNDCTITFSFVSKDGDQSYNFNKSFGGTYKVVVEE